MADPQFDVFLCHNSEDKPAVIEIAEQLKQSRLKPWLDIWELRPGVDWQEVLEEQIRQIRCVAVFVGKAGLGPWQKREMRAYIRAFIKKGSPVIPVLLPSAPKTPELPIFLEDFHWVDFRLQDPDPLVQLIWGVTGQKPEELLNTAQAIKTTEVAEDMSPSVNTQEELVALREELERLRAQPRITAKFFGEVTSPSPESDTELKSEKGIDYTRLRDLLKAGEWRDADQETADQMLKAMGKANWAKVSREDLLNFPCADLKTIDQLWVKYSHGKWGFSVQKRIYVECGAKLDGEYPGDEIWREFCRRVGWRKGDSYLNYSDLTFDLNSSTGEFPAFVVGLGGFGLGCVGGLVCCVCVLCIFSRIQTCKL